MKRFFIIAVTLIATGYWGNAQIVDTAHLHLSYVPTILNFQKLNHMAVINDTVQETVKFDYYITPQRLDVSFQPSPIKAAKMGPEVLDKLYRNFIKVGFGYPVTPLIEFSAHNLRNKKFSYGLNFHHFSSWFSKAGQLKDFYSAPTSDTRVDAYLTRFFNKQTLYSSIGYNHELANLYGFKPDDYPEFDFSDKKIKGNLKNNFNHLKAEVGLRSNYTLEEKKLKQDVRLNYDFLYTRHKSMENHIGLATLWNYDIRWMKISGSQNYRLDFDFDYYNNRFNLIDPFDTISPKTYTSRNNFLINLRPIISTSIKEYHITVGLGLPFTVADKKFKMYIYPIAELQLGLVPRILSIYAGVNGNVKYNALKDLLYENPFIKPTLDTLRYTRNHISIYGGVKGNLVKKLNYNVSARYSYAKDMVFYLIDTMSLFRNQFDVVYDNGGFLNVCLNLNWQALDNLFLNFEANYWLYHLNNFDKPWHKPMLEFAFSGNYTLKEKLILKLNFDLEFLRYAGIYNETTKVLEAQKMKPLIDFGIGAEYLITKNFSAFLSINNLACQYYSKYYDFKAFGINVLAGVTYSFGGETATLKKGRR